MNITIIGAGAFGAALGKILQDNRHKVTFFDQKEPFPTLNEALEEAEAAILAIPSVAVPEFARTMPEKLHDLPLIMAVKGLTSLEVFKDIKELSVLSGPAFAVDIMVGRPGTFTVTGKLAQELFENKQITVELTDDALGVELCGTLKNIYAVGAGVLVKTADEIGEYLRAALAEMKQYLENHGAKPETADLACGVGDLKMTATDEKSRNLRAGKMLLEGKKAKEICKELGTVEGLAAVANVDRKGYSIITKIYELVGA